MKLALIGSRVVDRASDVLVRAGEICPKAPDGAEQPTAEIVSYVLWGLGIAFLFGLLVSLGGIVCAKLFRMDHAGKVAVIGLVIIFATGVGYLILPGMLNSLLGDGCVEVPGLTTPTSTASPGQ